MPLGEVVGWIAAALGAASSLPQVVRCLKAETSAGISMFNWQATLGIAVAWTLHGIVISAPNMIVTNIVIVLGSAAIVVLVARDRAQSVVAKLILTPVPLLAVAMAIEHWLGSWAFGTAAGSFAAVGFIFQLLDIARSPKVSGVSVGFLVVFILAQASWALWGLLVGEGSVIASGGALAVLGIVNLVWYLMRRAGLPAIGRPRAGKDSDGVAAAG